MTLYEQWLTKAYNKKGESEKKLWDVYLPLEEKIYKEILKNKTDNIEGTVKELGQRFNMETDFMCGFLDGINEALSEPIDFKTLEEDTFVELEIDFESLYKKMVEYKADHLYSLEEWTDIFTEEELAEFYVEQKRSRTIVKGEKIGRNEPCPCGSGKKYKKCCGMS